MTTNIEFLGIYAQLSMAFVAFTTIVVTLRQAFGGQLSRIQYLMFRFFVEAGLLYIISAIIPLALFHIIPDELTVWRVSTAQILVVTLFYFPFYYRRRSRILGNAKLQPVNVITIVGYAVIIVFLLVTASEVWWVSSLATSTIFLSWGFISNAMVFAMVMGSFVAVAEQKFEPLEPS